MLQGGRVDESGGTPLTIGLSISMPREHQKRRRMERKKRKQADPFASDDARVDGERRKARYKRDKMIKEGKKMCDQR